MKIYSVLIYILPIVLALSLGAHFPYHTKVVRQGTQPQNIIYDSFGPYTFYQVEKSYLFNTDCEISILKRGEPPSDGYGFRIQSPLHCEEEQLKDEWTATGLTLKFSISASGNADLKIELPKERFIGGR
jgi:hypothetical protein